MERAKQDFLDELREDFAADFPDARELLAKIERTGLTLTRIQAVDTPSGERGPHSWHLYCDPGQSLTARFDLAPELLVVVSPWREAQGREIERAEDVLRHSLRLDPALVLLLAQDQGASARLAHAIGGTRRTYVVRSFDALLSASDPQRWLLDLLLNEVSASDLFAPGPPSPGWDFIGRTRQLERVRRQLFAGHPVGLFGLRKIGKTSLLLRLRDQLVQEAIGGFPVAIPIHLDMLAIPFTEFTRGGFFRQLLRSTYKALELAGIDFTNALKLPSKYALPQEVSKIPPKKIAEHVPVALEALLDWAAKQPTTPPVLLLIDEYERLLTGNHFPRSDGLDVLDYLRGTVQAHPGGFNFLVAGLDRRLAFTSRFHARQNPLFNFVVEEPLRGLESDELRDLFKKIGRRLCLRFEPEALAAIERETGGHPYLSREMGKLLDGKVSPAERQPKKIDTRMVTDHLSEWQRQVEPTMQEIKQTIVDLDPNAAVVLEWLAENPHAWDNGWLRPDVVHLLEQFGILEAQDGGFRHRIGGFANWLRENVAPSLPMAQHA